MTDVNKLFKLCNSLEWKVVEHCFVAKHKDYYINLSSNAGYYTALTVKDSNHKLVKIYLAKEYEVIEELYWEIRENIAKVEEAHRQQRESEFYKLLEDV